MRLNSYIHNYLLEFQLRWKHALKWENFHYDHYFLFLYTNITIIEDNIQFFNINLNKFSKNENIFQKMRIFFKK